MWVYSAGPYQNPPLNVPRRIWDTSALCLADCQSRAFAGEAAGHGGLEQWSPRTEVTFQEAYRRSLGVRKTLELITIYVFNLKNKKNEALLTYQLHA